MDGHEDSLKLPEDHPWPWNDWIPESDIYKQLVVVADLLRILIRRLEVE